MGDAYQDRQDSQIYGSRLIIFRRKDQQNDNFIFRAKIDGQKDYVRRSTKTNNPQDAMVIAHKAYDELRVRHMSGYSLTKITVEKFFNDWISTKSHRFTEQRAKWKKSVFDRYMLGYFGRQEVSGLTKKFVDGYWSYRLNFWSSDEGKKRIELNDKRAGAKTKSSHNVAKKPAYATLRAEASLINEILRAAVDEGHLARSITISAMDAIPKSEQGDGVRATFTEHEWRTLTDNLFNYAMNKGRMKGTRVHSKHRLQRRMLHAFVLLARATGMRVGELYQLKWSDFDKRRMDDGELALVVRVRRETSKVRKGRSAVASHEHIIGVMDSYRELSPNDKPDDLIFFSDKKGEISAVDLSTSFKNFLKMVPYDGRPDGLYRDKNGEGRTLYSIRHYYAIRRLQKNTDVFQLATAMGTGVSQIRKHYGSHISGDAFIAELTKNKRNIRKSDESANTAAVKRLVEMVESGAVDENMALQVLRNVVDSQSE